METIISFWNAMPDWVSALTGLMVSAKVITTMTPTTADDKIVAAILRFLNIAALNVGKAKNADDI